MKTFSISTSLISENSLTPNEYFACKFGVVDMEVKQVRMNIFLLSAVTIL